MQPLTIPPAVYRRRQQQLQARLRSRQTCFPQSAASRVRRSSFAIVVASERCFPPSTAADAIGDQGNIARVAADEVAHLIG